MLTPLFLTTEDLLELHQGQIDTYGGSPGIRDHGLLDSAVAKLKLVLEECI